jgi:hypothetical protein
MVSLCPHAAQTTIYANLPKEGIKESIAFLDRPDNRNSPNTLRMRWLNSLQLNVASRSQVTYPKIIMPIE